MGGIPDVFVWKIFKLKKRGKKMFDKDFEKGLKKDREKSKDLDFKGLVVGGIILFVMVFVYLGKEAEKNKKPPQYSEEAKQQMKDDKRYKKEIKIFNDTVRRVESGRSIYCKVPDGKIKEYYEVSLKNGWEVSPNDKGWFSDMNVEIEHDSGVSFMLFKDVGNGERFIRCSKKIRDNDSTIKKI